MAHSDRARSQLDQIPVSARHFCIRAPWFLEFQPAIQIVQVQFLFSPEISAQPPELFRNGNRSPDLPFFAR